MDAPFYMTVCTNKSSDYHDTMQADTRNNDLMIVVPGTLLFQTEQLTRDYPWESQC